VSVKIQIKRANASAWTAANPTLAAGEWGMELDTKKLKLGTGALWNSTDYYSETLTLNSVGDVTITSLQNGDFLRYSSSASAWINDPVNLSTDTVGDYVQSLVAGTGVTVTNNSGEGTTPTVAIGQAVSTSSSVTFAHVSAPVTGNVTGNLTGNADTAATLQTPRTISLSGDVSGSVSFNGSANVDITATVQPNSVALGTDTTGNYMSDLTQGTGVSITHTPGEGSNATIAIGQAVGTSSSVQFASVTAPLTGNASTATALETARNISLTGDVSGSVSFNGTSDVSISATVQPNSVALGTDTTGNYVNDLTQGTGVTVTHTPGEGSSPTVAIGQDVATSASVTFAHVSAPVTGSVTGNASTATTLQTGRTISLSGDVSGSVSFDGSADATISAIIQPNSVALGTDTTGNYVNDVAAGTGVTVTHTPAEGSSPTIAIGQDVATSASVTFARLETTGNVVIGGNLTVNGDTTTLNTETLSVEDNTIVLNSNATGSPTLNAGIEVERGDSANVSVRWNESTDSWELTEDGSTYKNIAVGQDVETSASVTFVAVTAELVGNSSTSSALKTPRTIALSGDVSGSVSFDGSANVDITATVQPNSVALGTDTTGNYVNDVTAGTGVTVTHTPGEGSSPTVAIGQAVGTSSSVQFAAVTAPLVGNASTATTLENARTISLSGDVSGSVSFNGSSDVTITATVQPNAVALGTDTTGDYVSSLVAGTGVTLTNNSGESATPTLAIGQDVGTSASVTFAHVSAPITGNVTGNVTGSSGSTTGNAATATALQNARTISLSGDVSGSVSFDGTSNVSISATVEPNSVALGTDTTGNYVNDLTAGTGVSITHTPAEGSSPTVAIGQSVATSASVTFAKVDTTGDITVGGNLTVNGTTTTLNTETLAIEDNIVVLNSNVTGSPATNAGIEVERGDSANVVLRWNESSDKWETTNDGSAYSVIATNGNIALGTDTTGNYVNDLTAGTGVTVTHTPGEGSSPTVAIGQAVGTSASVQFAAVTAPLIGNVTGNADTATTLATSRTIELTGDVTGSVSFNGSANASISATIAANSVALGTDTTGNYVNDLTAGTGVTVTHTPGEGTSPTVAIGQAVGTSSSVTFAAVTAPLIGNASTATALQTARNIAGQSFDGSANISIAPTDLTGVTSTAAELNILDGATLSTTELNYVDGVTSAVQTQIDAKAPSASPTFTGVVTLPDNTVALGTKTTGDYVSSLVAGTGVTLTNNSGETATPTVAIGQAVGTSASVTFAKVDTTGDVTVGGNLTVNGTTTTLNTETLAIEDNIVVLNSNVTGSPATNAGIEVERGTSANVSVRWNETSDKWEITEDGSTFYDIATEDFVLAQSVASLDEIGNVTASAAVSGDFLKYNGAAWVNDPINLGTDTVGNYMLDITAGTGISVSHTAGEGSSASVSLNATLDDLNGVNAPSLTDGDILKFISRPTSYIGTTWTTRRSHFGITDINSVAHGNNLWVAGGSREIRTSTDAVTWTTRTSNFGAYDDIQSVAYGNNLWVAGAGSGELRTSTDAITWTTRESNFNISSAAYGNSIWVLGGEYGGIKTSTDAITWTTRTSNFESGLSSVAHGNSLWVAAGSYGQLRTSTDAITWTTQTSNFGTTHIRSVAFGNSLWVAAGGSGQLRTSTDGTTWTTRTSNFGDYQMIRSLVYSNSLWTAAGNYGQIRTSTDAITWTTRTSNFGNTHIKSVAYGNNTLVAGGNSGKLRTSADSEAFVEWVPVNLNLDEIGDVSANYYNFQPLVWNGAAWTEAIDTLSLGGNANLSYVDISTSTGLSINYGGEGPFYETASFNPGQIQISNSDNESLTLSAQQMIFNDGTTGYFVDFITSVSEGKVLKYDNELTTWSAQTLDLDDLGDVSASSPSDGQFLKYVSASSAWVPAAVPTINALDDIGDVNAPSPTDGQVLTYVSASSAWVAADSTGGATAPTTTSITTTSATEIFSFDPTLYGTAEVTLQMKQGAKKTSSRALVNHDGSSTALLTQYAKLEHGSPVIPVTLAANYNTPAASWTTRTSNFGTTNIRSVSYGNSLWVAAGDTGQLRTSTDAITWTTRESNFTNQYGPTNILSVAYGNNLWVGGGDYGKIRTSTDAITWDEQTSNFGNTAIRSVAYGNNLWVAGGYNGQLRTSTDATTWTARTSNFGAYTIRSVAYANSLWVAGSTGGQLRTSTDAITWTTRTSNFGNTSILSIAYGNNLWVAAGYYGELRTSTDAITWTTRTSNLGSTNINSVAYGNNLWVAGGSAGQLRTSTDGITWTTRTSTFDSGAIGSVAYGNSLWVAGGNTGQLRTSLDAYKVVVTATVTDANVTNVTSKATIVLTEE
jgi:hypothetical protein